jgi:ketosteroid isomerase-like protein
MQTPELALQEVERFFNQLAPADLDRLASVYTEDAYFKDPFNEVRGLAAIRRIFAHMFDALERPRFVITQSVQQGAQCFVTWDFIFGLRGRPGDEITVRGASHLVLQEDGGHWRIAMHRDYWDVAEELYEKLPVLGSLMRWLKRRVNS